MPVISYPIQKSVYKTVGGRKRWYYEYEQILVDVNDATAEFFANESKREKRYKWKIKKQKQRANIYPDDISLDATHDFVHYTDKSGDAILAAETIEDAFHTENRDPIEILIDRESDKGREGSAALIEELFVSIMTKKQYEVWKLDNAGYRYSDMARILNIDESSVRERLENANKRIDAFLNSHKNNNF